jgi:Protein of unknown function (DUF2939).
MKKLLIAAITLVILSTGAIGGWYAWSPRWTLRQLREGAESGDFDRIASFIDKEKLRESWRATSGEQVEMLMSTQSDSEAADTRIMFSGLLANDPASPIVLRRTLSPHGGLGGHPSAGYIDVMGGNVVFDSPNRFRLVLDKNDPGLSAIIFERQGMGWKWSGYTYPPHAFE